MTRQQARPIVVGVDGSDTSTKAVRWAAEEGRRRGLPLKLVHAHEWIGGGPTFGFGTDGMREQSSQILAHAELTVRQLSEEVALMTAVSEVSAAAALVDESAEASMVVVGSRGRGGFAGLMLGSTSLTLVAHAHCPIVVIPVAWSGSASDKDRIVVGVDNSPASEAAVDFAMEEAALRGADVEALQTWHMAQFVAGWAPVPVPVEWTAVVDAEHAAFTESMAVWRTKYPNVRLDLHWEQGHPVPVLVAAGPNADLVVVGSRGRGAVAGLLLGSVSQGLLHDSTCPVAVVPQRR